MEGRCHMILSWKAIRIIFLSVETDLVQAQERSVLLTQSSSCLIAGRRLTGKLMSQSAVRWWEGPTRNIWGAADDVVSHSL